MSLTKYPEGSVRELWFVSAPLMLSSLSLLAMVFVDRVFLAHYSASAMSAAVTAGTAGWAVLGSLLIMCSMAEVFVAQYNGARMYKRVGKPVWQMVWFSLASLLLLVPLGFWGGDLLFREGPLQTQELLYWKWFLVLGVSFPMQAAFAAFWVGRGKTRMVMLLAIGANVANILLDWLLIFGVEGWLAPMGVKGAAIATNTGNFLQLVVLAVLFLKPAHREQYGTGRYSLNPVEMMKVMRVATPNATMFFIECLGWAIFYIMIGHVGPDQIFVAGIGQSVIILFTFAAEGLGRGASAVTGNLIGAGRGVLAFKVFRSGLKIHLIFFAFASLFLVIFPQSIMDVFMSDAFIRLHEFGGQASAGIAQIELSLQITLQLCLFYLLFEGMRWLISGILASAGDTLFLLITGTITVPFFMLLPTYMLVERLHLGVTVAFSISITYAFCTSTIFLWRFYGRKWQKINLLA